MPTFLSRLFGGASALARPQNPPIDTKASRTGALLAFQALGLARWTPRNAAELTRQGFERNAIVYRCVRMIAESAATIPWLIYEDGLEDSDHPAAALLRRPNPGEARAQFLEGVFTNLMLSGSAYIEAVSLDGAPREFHNLRPDRMAIAPGPNGWPAAYEYTLGAQKITFPVDDNGVSPVLHLKLFHPMDDHYGFAPLCAAQAALDIHNAAGGWNKALLDNAARPSGALVYHGPEGASLTEDQFDRLKAELDETFSGPRNAGRPLLLDGGLDWKALSLSPKDMDFVEAKASAAREIALAFGIPPLVLGLPGDNTFSNYQEANRAFWRQAVIPLVKRTQQSFAEWLRPVWGEFAIEADLDRIDALAGERETEWRRIGAASFLSDDEKREALGYRARAQKDFDISGDSLDTGGADSGTTPGGGNGHWQNQPRVPAGNADGGQWTDGGGGGDSRASGDQSHGAEFDRNSRIDLRNEEAPNGIGHTLDKHVGKTDQELLDRMERERYVIRNGNIRIVNYSTAIGTFHSIEDANAFVNEALQANLDAVNSVARGDIPSATINYRVGNITGIEAYRPSGDQPSYIRPTYEVRIDLRHLPNTSAGFGVRTSFPVNPLGRLQ